MSRTYGDLPFTKEQLFHDYINLGMSQLAIGKKYRVSSSTVTTAMKRMGIKARGNRKSKKECSRVLGSLRPIQNRSKLSKNGYYYLRLYTHPNANKLGYVAEHIFMITEHIGRPLHREEIVHHINLDQHDNRVENLAVCNRKTHRYWHHQLEKIAIELLKRGFLSFDPENGYLQVLPI